MTYAQTTNAYLDGRNCFRPSVEVYILIVVRYQRWSSS
jgi:hypothetical protein